MCEIGVAKAVRIKFVLYPRRPSKLNIQDDLRDRVILRATLHRKLYFTLFFYYLLIL